MRRRGRTHKKNSAAAASLPLSCAASYPAPVAMPRRAHAGQPRVSIVPRYADLGDLDVEAYRVRVDSKTGRFDVKDVLDRALYSRNAARIRRRRLAETTMQNFGIDGDKVQRVFWNKKQGPKGRIVADAATCAAVIRTSSDSEGAIKVAEWLELCPTSVPLLQEWA